MQRKLQALTEEVDRLRRQGRCSCIPMAPVARDVVPRSTYTQLQRKHQSLMERVRQLERCERELQILQNHNNQSEGHPDHAAGSNVQVAAAQEEMVTEEQVPNGKLLLVLCLVIQRRISSKVAGNPFFLLLT
ncbi:hypothetical protein MRX96_040428 [Rhipicephalus microplus]